KVIAERPYDSNITDLAFSPDGRMFLMKNSLKHVQTWNALPPTPRGQLRKLRDALLTVTAAALSPDGRVLLSINPEGRAELRSADDCEPIRSAFICPGPVKVAAWSPDGRRVATGDRNGQALIWDIETGKTMGTPCQHRAEITSLSF